MQRVTVARDNNAELLEDRSELDRPIPNGDRAQRHMGL